jgi:hypothetical protein|tara:strand:- start:479 stop:676 length:198 start_codon:yes stop_codon:yes gene_type:complete
MKLVLGMAAMDSWSIGMNRYSIIRSQRWDALNAQAYGFGQSKLANGFAASAIGSGTKGIAIFLFR